MFSGKKVFITGGSSGIGKQLALDFVRLGAHVAVLSNDAAKLEATRAELAVLSPSVSAFHCDVADLEQVRRATRAYIEHYGAPDVLVNNAGYAVYRTFEETSTEEITRLLSVNFIGACIVTREFLPFMIEARGGHVVIMASIAGRVVMTPCGVYSAAKHGLVAWAETLRVELKRFRIHLHVICPGRVETDFFHHDSFVQRAPRQESRWTVPVAAVSEATIRAIQTNRFLTHIPRSHGLLVWLTNAFPVLFKPLLARLMTSRVESIYQAKEQAPR